jgi:hypothetical protein
MAEHSEWTEADVRRILSNPIYVGIGPFPRIIADDLWISAQVRLVEEHGVRPRLRAIRTALHEALGYQLPRLATPTWLDDSYRAVAAEGLEVFLHRFITQVRADVGGPSDTVSTA